MQEDLTQQHARRFDAEGFASNFFRVWFWLRLKLAKLNVLCYLVASKNFGLFFESKILLQGFQ